MSRLPPPSQGASLGHRGFVALVLLAALAVLQMFLMSSVSDSAEAFDELAGPPHPCRPPTQPAAARKVSPAPAACGLTAVHCNQALGLGRAGSSVPCGARRFRAARRTI
jgi:hypothetical protein